MVLFFCGTPRCQAKFLYSRPAAQGCQMARFAAEFRKFGDISSWLAVRLLGWPFGFFWPFFKGRLTEKFFC